MISRNYIIDDIQKSGELAFIGEFWEMGTTKATVSRGLGFSRISVVDQSSVIIITRKNPELAAK